MVNLHDGTVKPHDKELMLSRYTDVIIDRAKPALLNFLMRYLEAIAI